VVRYLSPEWFTEANKLLEKQPPLESSLTISVVVTEGEVRHEYSVVFGPDRVALINSGPAPGSLTLQTDWETATAIAQGEASAQQSFLDNRLQILGSANDLVENAKALAQLNDTLSELRERTDFRIRS
jgi:hypothetical protein